MKRAGLIAVLCGSMLMAAPAAGATSGSISGGVANSTWTTGSVTNLSVTFDNCNDGSGLPCPWSAIAGLWPTALGGCPSDWTEISNPDVFWVSSSSADGTLESGAKSFSLGSVYGQRVCLYWYGKVHVLAPNPIDPGTGKPLCKTTCGYFEIPVSSLLATKVLEVEAPPPSTTVPAQTPGAGTLPKKARKRKCPKGTRRVRRAGKQRCIRKRQRKSRR